MQEQSSAGADTDRHRQSRTAAQTWTFVDALSNDVNYTPVKRLQAAPVSG